jgi:hypothetical protein
MDLLIDMIKGAFDIVAAVVRGVVGLLVTAVAG